MEAAVESLSQKLGLDTQMWSAPTGLFLSIGEAQAPAADRRRVAEVLRLSPGEVNLRRLVDVDQVADRVFRDQLSVDEGYARLASFDPEPARFAPQAFGFAFGSASIAAMLRARPIDIVVAAALGFMCGSLAVWARGRPERRPSLEGLAAFFAALGVALVSAYLTPLTISSVTLAAIVVFLPGLALTTGVTELAHQHLVSGTAKMAGAIVVLLKLTFGVVAGNQLAHALGVPVRSAPAMAAPAWIEIVALMFGAFAYTLLLRPHKRHRWLVMGAAVLGFAAARGGSASFGPDFGVFLAGMVVAAASNLFARLKNRPSALVRVPGILLLVPGSIGFRSLFFVFDGQVIQGVTAAFALVVLLATLMTGLLFGDLLVPPRRSL
jgi:uncharacterized membrane protein YjjP (DUF1212 family)